MKNAQPLRRAVERWQAGQARRSQDVFLHAGGARVEIGIGRSLQPRSMRSQAGMEGFIPIHIRYGDKNGVFLQRLDISPLAPTVMRYWQASYTAIAVVFGVLCGSTERMLASLSTL